MSRIVSDFATLANAFRRHVDDGITLLARLIAAALAEGIITDANDQSGLWSAIVKTTGITNAKSATKEQRAEYMRVWRAFVTTYGSVQDGGEVAASSLGKKAASKTSVRVPNSVTKAMAAVVKVAEGEGLEGKALRKVLNTALARALA